MCAKRLSRELLVEAFAGVVSDGKAFTGPTCLRVGPGEGPRSGTGIFEQQLSGNDHLGELHQRQVYAVIEDNRSCCLGTRWDHAAPW